VTHVRPEPASILIVGSDDRELARVSQLLGSSERLHCTLERVRNPTDARERLIAGTFDACLVDWRLADCGGRELISEARRRRCATPIIALTEADDHALDAEIIGAGAFDCLPRARVDGWLLERTLLHALAGAFARAPDEQGAVRQRSIGALGATIAHEINNPLAVLLINLDLLRAEARDPEDAQLADEAAIAAGRIRRVARDLLTLWRSDADTRRPLDLRAAMEAALVIAGSDLRRHTSIVKELYRVPLVEANAARLEQVFETLLVNAAGAIPEHSATRHEIRVRTYTDVDGNAIVEVRDSGVGIAPEILPRIFDPFFTTRPPGAGSGLGLSMCHAVVSSIGGSITAESQLQRGGSLFRVRLPAAALPRTRDPQRILELPSARRPRVLFSERNLEHEYRGELVVGVDPHVAAVRLERQPTKV
jgi:signal transduction histidine kinase